MLPANNEDDMSYEDCTDDLNRVCAGSCRMQQAIRRSFFPISQMTRILLRQKLTYAKDMVTGFLRLNGTTVGAVANRTEVYGEDGEVSRRV